MFSAAEAMTAGYGGVIAVSEFAGLARSTIDRGFKEVEYGSEVDEGRARRPDHGRRGRVPAWSGTGHRPADHGDGLCPGCGPEPGQSHRLTHFSTL